MVVTTVHFLDRLDSYSDSSSTSKILGSLTSRPQFRPGPTESSRTPPLFGGIHCHWKGHQAASKVKWGGVEGWECASCFTRLKLVVFTACTLALRTCSKYHCMMTSGKLPHSYLKTPAAWPRELHLKSLALHVGVSAVMSYTCCLIGHCLNGCSRPSVWHGARSVHACLAGVSKAGIGKHTLLCKLTPVQTVNVLLSVTCLTVKE